MEENTYPAEERTTTYAVAEAATHVDAPQRIVATAYLIHTLGLAEALNH